MAKASMLEFLKKRNLQKEDGGPMSALRAFDDDGRQIGGGLDRQPSFIVNIRAVKEK